ncbi:MAG TPA: hypothetical protein RMH99_28840 [Sandaracinaceae bacterium LLY-WYZ-13_1]|nr:hypothetical protein [Sandaracinaceae bacterium LLY-WYZ-13_1]
MDPRCPLCDAEALYVGLRRVECPTEGCANHRPPEGRGGGEPSRLGTLDPARFPYELLFESHAYF